MAAKRDFLALVAFLDARHASPHAWGRREGNDCVALALGAVEAQTGVRPAVRLEWSDRASALRIIRKYGSLEAAFDAFFDRVPPALAKRGDIAAVPAGIIAGPCAREATLIGVHPMVVEGPTLCSPGEHGLVRAPRRLATIAWDAMSARANARRKKASVIVGGPSKPTGAADV
jgi:hypothetical protein